MSSTPFFRPMLAGFVITATTILVLPMVAKAQPAPAATQCDPSVPKPHGIKLGHILSAVQNSGVMPFLGAPGLAASLAGTLASTAIDATGRSRVDADRRAAPMACNPSND